MTDYLTRGAWEAANRKEQALIAAEEDADRRDALAAALNRDDEVYLVPGSALEPTRVFGHEDDAKAYGLATRRGWVAVKVLDHAEARALIEGEG